MRGTAHHAASQCHGPLPQGRRRWIMQTNQRPPPTGSQQKVQPRTAPSSSSCCCRVQAGRFTAPRMEGRWTSTCAGLVGQPQGYTAMELNSHQTRKREEAQGHPGATSSSGQGPFAKKPLAWEGGDPVVFFFFRSPAPTVPHITTPPPPPPPPPPPSLQKDSNQAPEPTRPQQKKPHLPGSRASMEPPILDREQSIHSGRSMPATAPDRLILGSAPRDNHGPDYQGACTCRRGPQHLLTALRILLHLLGELPCTAPPQLTSGSLFPVHPWLITLMECLPDQSTVTHG